MKKGLFLLFLISVTLTAGLKGQDGRFSLELETGPVWNSFNKIAIPGDIGTRFSLPDALDVQSRFAFRLRLNYRLAKRHSLSVLYAPLQLEARGRLPEEIYFTDRTFARGSEVNALYRFNSYRLSYRYTWVDGERIRFQVGFTAKIRDAEIALSDNGGSASKTNVGFVPLLYLGFRWKLADRLYFKADLDALAAKQGRAEDLFLGFEWSFTKRLEFMLGYRMVEGGADNEEVYNFAWLHYLSAGVRVRL